MAKLSKNMLKSLVKECLVEILSEGIGTATNSRSQTRERRQLELERQHTQRTKSLDNIQFKQRVDESVSAITKDPLMASILADTAATTLQEQVSAESYPGSPPHPSSLSSGGDHGNSLDVFSEASQNWANLAFADKKLR